MSLKDSITHMWNVFKNKDPTPKYSGYSYYGPRPWTPQLNGGPDNSIAGAIYNRIALDVADLQIRHIKVDKQGNFKEYIDDSYLDKLFTVEANLDQIPQAFMQDLVLTMFHQGVAAIVTTWATEDPNITMAFQPAQVRVGEVLEYRPQEVRVKVYDDRDGQQTEIWVEKKNTPIIQNPFYFVMNKPNSIGQRLIRKLSILDYIDDDIASGRWNMLIKMPYSVKQDLRKKHARERVNEIQDQLKNNPLGIGYIDSTEQITQLNRPLESGILDQVTTLQNMFFAQLGITEDVLNGSANEDIMTNYYGRTVEPVIKTIVDEMKRKWISKTARSQGQSIKYFRDPFKLVSATRMADISDKYTRNEILSSNDVRASLGKVPDDNPRSDELVNKNINHPSDEEEGVVKKKEED